MAALKAVHTSTEVFAASIVPEVHAFSKGLKGTTLISDDLWTLCFVTLVAAL